MLIYCCECCSKVDVRLTDGREIYPHERNLRLLPFWICDACGNYVGCHHKSNNKTKPLGCIPTPEIRKARRDIHRLVDPIWQSGKITRKDLYKYISHELGRKYHTANIRSMDEVNKIYCIIRDISIG